MLFAQAEAAAAAESTGMKLAPLDWGIVIAFFAIALTIGAVVSRKSGQNASEFFLSGRNMPWWLLGFSMVATTFAADTPGLVTGLVRKDGVAGNWAWWAFLLTGMLTVFVYAKLWRRIGVLTDIEFYELRYSGKTAGFLRAFRALYLGVFFNVIVMANVTLAAIKIGAALLGFNPYETILVASIVTVCFSAMGGLRGVLITDCLLFVVAMVGSVGAAYVVVNMAEVGGLTALLTHENVADKLSLWPEINFSDPKKSSLLYSILIVPLAVQWWSVWYPGAEPGGGGYIAQRMLAAKSEKHATGATLFFNVAHYALRPWPWILVALASLVVFPDVASLQREFASDLLPESQIADDLAYSAMLRFLPSGLLGLVVASLIAAYMSTISTHLNWGSSYVVNDYWKRFHRPEADDRELVRVGRISTVVMMVLAAGLALLLRDAVQGFQILLQVGAGTGLLFILRWFWWRINAYSELTAMIVSFLVAVVFLVQGKVIGFLDANDLTLKVITGLVDSGLSWTVATFLLTQLQGWEQLVLGVVITTVSWILVTYVTRPDDDKTLRDFYSLVRPGGHGWKKVIDKAAQEGVTVEGSDAASGIPIGLTCMAVGCIGVYATLFATGFWLYGDFLWAAVLTAVAIAAAFAIFKMWNRVHED
jgi:Na+/proline symporter